MYAVLGRRRARILREEMREGSDTFLVGPAAMGLWHR